MRKKMRKTLSLLLSAAMCVSLSVVPAYAAGTTEPAVSEDHGSADISTEDMETIADGCEGGATITAEISWPDAGSDGPGVDGTAATESDAKIPDTQETGSGTGQEPITTETTQTSASVSEDGRTTTVTVEAAWSGPEGGNPAVEGEKVTTETTVVDDDGRVTHEGGSESGHETVTTETVTSETTTEEKDAETGTVTGGVAAVESPGEFETVDSSVGSTEEAVDPVFPDGGDIMVNLAPGSSATGTAEVDRQALAGQLPRPDEGDTDIVDAATGEVIGHKTTTVEDIVDGDGSVVGFTSTVTEETTETTVLPETGSSAEPPTMPQPQEPVTDADGVTTRVDVEPVYDGDGNLSGYKTTTTKTRTTETAVTETVLPDRPAEGETVNGETGETTVVHVSEIYDENGALAGYEVTTTITGSDGSVRTEVETLRGTKTSTSLAEVTDVTVTTVTFTKFTGSTVTTTTRSTTTESKRIVATDRAVTAEMGNVTAGENDGILETNGVQAEVAEPDVGKTDQNTDLYHRPDKDSAAFDPDGYDFQWLGEYGLESAIRVDAVQTGDDGTATPSDKWQAHQFVLVDKDGNKHYVYCADFAVSPQAGFRYDMENVEDAGYYDSEAAAHIRAIAQNGYWGTAGGAGSLDAVKKMMADAYHSGKINKDDYDGLATAWGFEEYLTDGMALAATQAALWTFGNSGSLVIDRDDPFTSYYQAIPGSSWRDLDSRERALTKALYDYLISQTEAPDDRNTLINENNFAANASLTVGQLDEDSGRYEADLSFTLAVMPDMESDDLLVHVVVDGKVVETRRIAGDDAGTQYGYVERNGDGSYTLSGLKLADGVNIDLRLTGTQNIGEGVYLFTSEISSTPTGYDEDGEPVFSSQTFVGVESGRQSVDLSVSLNFTVQEAAASVVTEHGSMTEQKTDITETSHTDTATATGGRVETVVTVTAVQKSDREWNSTWEKDYTYPDPEPETPDKPEKPEEPDKPEKPDTPNEPEEPNKPDTPVEPEKPETPDNPQTPDLPPEEPPAEEIPEPDVPKADDPAGTPDAPVFEVPKTGDNSGLWYVLMAVSLIGLTVMGCQEIQGRKKKTDG